MLVFTIVSAALIGACAFAAGQEWDNDGKFFIVGSVLLLILLVMSAVTYNHDVRAKVTADLKKQGVIVVESQESPVDWVVIEWPGDE